MDLKGSLLDTNLQIFPSEKLILFLKSLPTKEEIPKNISKLLDSNSTARESIKNDKKDFNIHLDNEEIKILTRIKESLKNYNMQVQKEETEVTIPTEKENKSDSNPKEKINSEDDGNSKKENYTPDENTKFHKRKEEPFLTTADIDWIYTYLHRRRTNGDKTIPYLHDLFEGSDIKMPDNQMIKRNPVLEARCVKLRAQQEAREYRKMTKTVDNVRLRFPEDSISYQLKQMNRQLIAIGQFILSIFAGFMFGFRGVEWMVGNLDFGFRMLLGVMCALVIALAEIYFLAKKLNEELNIPETVQLGGPPKFADEKKYGPAHSMPASVKTNTSKEHQE